MTYFGGTNDRRVDPYGTASAAVDRRDETTRLITTNRKTSSVLTMRR
jgi:hypothetical protein